MRVTSEVGGNADEVLPSSHAHDEEDDVEGDIQHEVAPPGPEHEGGADEGILPGQKSHEVTQ